MFRRTYANASISTASNDAVTKADDAGQKKVSIYVAAALSY